MEHSLSQENKYVRADHVRQGKWSLTQGTFQKEVLNPVLKDANRKDDVPSSLEGPSTSDYRHIIDLPYVMSLPDDFDPDDLSKTGLKLMQIKMLSSINNEARDKPCAILKESKRTLNPPRRARQKQRQRPTGPHPQDVMLACFMDSGLTLKQMICQKSFMCKLAIPLIYPGSPPMIDTVGVQSVVLSWQETDSMKYREMAAPLVKTDVISFLRAGKMKFSKSKFINSLLTDTSFTFYEKALPCGSYGRETSNGAVEISWYLPSETHTNLSEVATILNLRGEATLFHKQVELIVSTVICVFASLDEVKSETFVSLLDVLKANGSARRIIVFATQGCEPDDFDEREFRLLYTFEDEDTDVNLQELKDDTLSVIKEILNHCEMKKTLHEITSCASSLNFQTDNDRCEPYKKLAFEIISHIGTNVSDFKAKWVILPEKWKQKTDLQEDLIATLENEGDKRDELLDRMISVTAELSASAQAYHSRPVTETFINAMAHLYRTYSSDRQDLQVYLGILIQCIKIALDDKSRECLPILNAKYDEAVAEYNESKRSEKFSLDSRDNLSAVANCLTDSSMGVENLLREIGLMYAVIHDYDSVTDETLKYMLPRFPDLMVNLMLEGFPLEIMDGDNCTIYFPWIKYVFKSLQLRLGKKKVMILSVLGVQSSGKSTLLNAMFGLQFAVSAGRCTRGVFAQLVQLEHSTQKKYALDFDSILVIDTEGLRATELESGMHKHDNEIATFVIGLADVTIINVKGENYSEIQDMLQIAVHAFLRMKLVAGTDDCGKKSVFVHQNVADVGAGDKMKLACHKLKEALDEASIDAAKMELRPDIKSVDDVLGKKWTEHVYYFSSLWNGDPPMASTNVGYCSRILKVKKLIYSLLSREYGKGKFPYITLKSIPTRIHDLWGAIRSDDFVFNFRNSLEVRAFFNFEKNLREATAQFESEILRKYANQIENNISSCETIQDLVEIVNKSVSNLRRDLEKLAEDIIRNPLETMISQNPSDSQLIEVWERRQATLVDTAISNVKVLLCKTFAPLIEQRQQEIHSTGLLGQQLGLLAYNTASALRNGYPSEALLQKEYNKFCDEYWPKMLGTDISQKESIESILIKTLSTFFFQFESKINENLRTNPLSQGIIMHNSVKLQGSIASKDIKKHFITMKKKRIGFRLVEQSRLKSYSVVIVDLDKVFEEIDCYLSTLQMHSVCFEPGIHVNKMLSIFNSMTNVQNEKNEMFAYTSEFIVYIAIHICRFALPIFVELDRYCDQNNRIRRYLAEKRENLWTLFKQSSIVRSDEVNFATIISDVIHERLIVKMEDETLKHVIHCFYKLFKSKERLLYNILYDLAKNESFEDYNTYLNNSKYYAKIWISKYIDTRSYIRNALNHAITKKMGDSFKRIKKSLWYTHSCLKENQEVSVKVYIKSLCHDLSKNGINLPDDKFWHLMSLKVSNWKTLSLNVYENVCVIHGHLMSSIPTRKLSFLEIQLLLDSLWGCQEECPFCWEPCAFSTNAHVKEKIPHRCLEHRPIATRGPTLGVISSNMDRRIIDCTILVRQNGYFPCSLKCRRNKASLCFSSTKDNDKHRLVEYLRYFPNWNLRPKQPITCYWVWVLTHFRADFEKRHQYKFSDRDKETMKKVSKKAMMNEFFSGKMKYIVKESCF